MANQLTVNNSIEINAPADKVWDALTNPEKTKVYMFGCEALSDWEVGSELLWQANYEGQDLVFVKGHIVSIEPNKKLIYSTFDPNSTIPDIPENYLNVTYELADNNGKTILNVSQGDYSTVADGQRRYCEALNNGEGWNPILVEIKKLIEEN
ncbi:SRPBCC domain-containing protein [Flavobacterium sp. PS2]|uniref:SRPBCC domain-containing protein n=1 Tax=Flavobacterium sp. PS2 TaxID=3384157 RepID=UPI00390CA22C